MVRIVVGNNAYGTAFYEFKLAIKSMCSAPAFEVLHNAILPGTSKFTSISFNSTIILSITSGSHYKLYSYNVTRFKSTITIAESILRL